MKVRLSVLRTYLNESFVTVLVEGRVDDAREKYPDMEEEDFDYLVANQPTGSNNKYLMWSCKQADALLQDDPDRQALTLVIQAVRHFDANQQRLQKRDINQYDTVTDLETAVAEIENKKTRGQQAREARADTDTLYQDDRFMVVRPHTVDAACKYGTGTKWCIAATGSHNYFNSYSTSNNKFYFVIDKKGHADAPETKFAITIKKPDVETSRGEIQVFNSADRLVNLSVVENYVGDKWPEIWSKIVAHVKSRPLTREVEDAQKATEEHVKDLLAGKSISDQAAQKIATDGTLSTPVVKALLKRYENYQGPTDHRDTRLGVASSLANRANEMSSEAIAPAIMWLDSLGPNVADGYWPGRYTLERMINSANLSPAAFQELIKNASERTLSLLLKNPNITDSLTEEISKRVKDFKNSEARATAYNTLIQNGKITREQFVNAVITNPNIVKNALFANPPSQLSGDLIRMIPINSVSELKAAMRMPNIQGDHVADLIDKLWKRMNKHELYEILKTAPVPVEAIEKLWKGKGQDIRTALLQNPSIGAENASRFSLSQNSAYRFAVAHNLATPGEDLNLLSTDESVSTRAAVAANPKTPGETLVRLSNDEAIAVRASVASNPATPKHALDLLKKDQDDFVRKSARKTLKSLETAESFVRLMSGMTSLLREELEDEPGPITMSPAWKNIPGGYVSAEEFVAIFLLQNNGHATKEEIEAAFQAWNPQYPTTRRAGGGYRGGYRFRGRVVNVPAKTVWSIIKDNEQGNHTTRATTSGGKGWWWSPASINKGALFRLTPAGAAVAISTLTRLREQNSHDEWTQSVASPQLVKKSPPPVAPVARTGAGAPAAPRGPKTTYKIYGKFKGHPTSTRLKGQAYVGPANTRFSPGEQAEITPDNGKLKVKKADSDHTQTWEPIDG